MPPRRRAGDNLRHERGLYHPGEMTAATKRLYCPDCYRSRSSGGEAAGALRSRQAYADDASGSEPCDIGNSLSGPQCQQRYWGRMTLETREEAGAKGGLPSWTQAPT